MTTVDFDTLNLLGDGELGIAVGVSGAMSSQEGSKYGGMGLRRDATVTIVMSLSGERLAVKVVYASAGRLEQPPRTVFWLRRRRVFCVRTRFKV